MSDTYTDQMTRHSSEIERLEQQFDLMTANIGYTLHPSVAANLPEKPRIADIGTGTGHFLLKLHSSYPDARLDGFDISSDLYPAEGTHPSNVFLTVSDAKQPPPEDLRGQYDLVHVRMLIAAMLPTDWDTVVRNLCLMLKPGGFLQWEECDFIGCKYLRGAADSTVAAAGFMGYAFRDALRERFEHGWSTLPKNMADAGLTPVLTDVISSDRLPETRDKLTTTGMKAIFSWARLMTERGVPGSLRSEELDDLEKKAYDDIKSGCYARYDIYVACGRKPLE